MALRKSRNTQSSVGKVRTRTGGKVPPGSMRQPPAAKKPALKLTRLSAVVTPLGQGPATTGPRKSQTAAAVKRREAAAQAKGKAKETRDPKASSAYRK